ncbi:hypothetical protein EDB89DRAFT_2069481 [Lactarius sanguifluus]|nr:hypothetical protein EDB89DRAFT_2069481 [Lactarius sanguifluus]
MAHAATGRPCHHRPAVLPAVQPTSSVMALASLPSCGASVNTATEPEQDRNTVSRSFTGPDPTCSPALYAKTDLSSLNGWCLRGLNGLVRDAFAEAGSLSPTISACSRYSTIRHTPLRGPALRSVAIHTISWLCPQLHSTLPDTNCRFPFVASGAPLDVPFSFAEFPLTAPDGLDLGTWTVGELKIREMGAGRMERASVRLAG